MNLNKRCFSFLLSLLLILSSVNLSFAQKTAFTDVPDNHWASNVIGKWSGERYNVLKGDGKGNFHPNKGLTLGEFTTILSKTFGYTQRVSAEVTPMWAKDPIEKAITAGILPKTDTVNANQIVTRQQAIKYIALAFSIQAEEGETLFADNKDISKEYKPYVKAFQEMGYVGGDNKDISKAKFNPQANYTRAEAMQVIDNTISDIIDKQTKDKTYPKNIIIRKENTTLENIKTKESLIIGQGAKDSKINIDKVEIGKSLIIYGGEEITVNNDSPIKNTIVNKPYKKDITLKGKFTTITVHDKTTLHIIGEAEKIILLGSAKATLNGKEVQSSTTDNKKTNSNTGGTGSGGSGGNNPSIIVTTPFPTGKTENNAIDVKYTATPSKGATIKQVSYIINDDLEEYIYLSGGDGINQKGTLGTGRVLLLPGENKVVFKVIDSSGKSATFDVKERPNFDYGIQTPKAQSHEISNLIDGSGGKFINNRIIIYLKNETDSAQTQEIVKYLDGTIIGKNNVVNKIVIRIQKNTEDELKAICEDIKNKYPDTVEHATIEKLGLIGPTTNTMHTNDPWWNEIRTHELRNQDDVVIGRDENVPLAWGARSINAPDAWRNIERSSSTNREIRVGIIDNGVRRTHSDLNIPSIMELRTWKNHSGS